eukprot:CAMPEP_0179491564 /NCGR_PEP_ID=MMETSP0799-20121207/66166_1 /TAXON_ID=46947 /ORGANISM="Geminigera cryophila, Strain CCMP2564" /LENGTH=116 /DNA_ID=CAMNT_0021308045 /DNA_START=579 /DNA_END=929 /DNA_ORIENTATION=-
MTSSSSNAPRRPKEHAPIIILYNNLHDLLLLQCAIGPSPTAAGGGAQVKNPGLIPVRRQRFGNYFGGVCDTPQAHCNEGVRGTTPVFGHQLFSLHNRHSQLVDGSFLRTHFQMRCI